MEKFQTLQTLCQIGIALFSILVILCGYGSYHFGEKKENAKLKSQKIDVTYGRSDSIPKSKTTYNINGGDLVQGDKVSKTKKEEINAPSALIVTKNQSGGENTVNFYQNEYKPLNKNIEEEISDRLDKLALKYPNAPTTMIEIESGNSQRNKIAIELEELLTKNNLGVYPKGNTFMGRFPDYPVSVFINPANRNYTKELLSSLELFISGEFKIIEDNAFPNNIIKIYINGQPLFDTSGKTKIQ